MEFIQHLVDIFLHLDVHLNDLAATLGPWLYVLLFLIVFAETGLVVTPFLPGDSLLFAVGALASREGSPINVGLAVVLLAIAAVLGDAVNYAIGYRVGPRVFVSETSRLLNKEHLRADAALLREVRRQDDHPRALHAHRAHLRAVRRRHRPACATRSFAAYNVVGGVVWVAAFTLAGYFFGNVPVVKRNFHYVIVAIIVISMLPPVIEFLRARRGSTVTD